MTNDQSNPHQYGLLAGDPHEWSRIGEHIASNANQFRRAYYQAARERRPDTYRFYALWMAEDDAWRCLWDPIWPPRVIH